MTLEQIERIIHSAKQAEKNVQGLHSNLGNLLGAAEYMYNKLKEHADASSTND